MFEVIPSRVKACLFKRRSGPEYEGSMVRLWPPCERIRLADELIDDVVHRLYGLTEEEARIVEGNKQN
jgi:hypothetical protein